MIRAPFRLVCPVRTLLPVLVLALAMASVTALPGRADHPARITVTVVAPDGSVRRSLTFDRAALARLPQTEFTTRTIWTDGPQHFRGVALAALLAQLGTEATHVELDAINDYTVSIPAAEIAADYPVIAYSRNGAAMHLRDMGPFWLVYNYDADPAFRTQTAYARSIWQLERITVHLATP